MSKFKKGDLVNLVPYETLVERGYVKKIGGMVCGIDKAIYESLCMNNPYTVYSVNGNGVMTSFTGYAYPDYCLEFAEPTVKSSVKPTKRTSTLKYGFSDTVSVLGTTYRVSLVNKLDGDGNLGGFCDADLHQIKLLDLSKVEGWSKESIAKIKAREKEIFRHEIVHAFFDESGLKFNTTNLDQRWADNEEMVDWFAIQGPKIVKAWREAGCL